MMKKVTKVTLGGGGLKFGIFAVTSSLIGPLELCCVLEIWYVSTHTCNFRKYLFYHQNPLDFADVSIFLQKVSIFGAKIVSLLKALV